MDMVERVARALCARLGRDPDTLGPSIVVTDMGSMGIAATFNGPPEPAWKSYEAEARAAIEAMREPTEAMVEAGSDAPIMNYDGNDPRDVWRLMISAALTPPPSGEM
jgi:hypothetical protein